MEFWCWPERLAWFFLSSTCTAIEGKGICGPGNLLKVCGKTQFLLFTLHCSIKQHRGGSSELPFWRQEGSPPLSIPGESWRSPLKPEVILRRKRALHTEKTWEFHLISKNSLSPNVKSFCTALELAPSQGPKFFLPVIPTDLKGHCCFFCFSLTDFFFLATPLQSSPFSQTKLNCLVSISNMSSKNRGQVFLRRCERVAGFSWIVDDAVTVGYLLFLSSTKEHRNIFNSIYWCLVKPRQVCACCTCTPCRQRGIAANNPVLCPCGSRFSFQRHLCKLSGAISTGPLWRELHGGWRTSAQAIEPW